MDGRQPADRKQRRAEAGATRAGCAERLTIPRSITDSTAGSLARTLGALAALAAIRGDDAERALLVRAGEVVQAHGIETDADLAPLVEDASPLEDDEVRRRLRQMYEAGAWVLLESALADLPADLRWLYESDAVTIQQLQAIHDHLNVTSAADIVFAVDGQRIRHVPGCDPRVEYAVAAALFDLRRSVPRVALGRATALADPILARLTADPDVTTAAPAGSLRRGELTVGDVEFVVATRNPEPLIAELSEWPGVVRVLHRSARRLYVLIDRVQVGFRVVDPASAGAVLLMLTGSDAHLAALRRLAREHGYDLGPEGLGRDGSIVAADTETAIYQALGLPYIAPEIRAGDGEIDAALAGELPPLIERGDIRGDLHMHTSWSDGRDSVEAMVRAARDLGYEYVAITDHSPQCAASRTLTVEGVKKQADEIATLRERYPDIGILHGCEVDILRDGSLDFADSILERFDIVLASLHDSAGHGPEQLMRRYAGALEHPLVNLITHPTNRILPNRDGYDLDYRALFDIAAETGTLVEIDGAPAHLDLDGELARRAAAAGATLVVSSDCHRADALDRQMRLGLTMARRGWVESRHVLNTRPLADIRAFVARKRSA